MERLPVAGLLHLLVIYLIWGSTYLGIRVAVRPDAGFAPFTLGAMRVIVAGALLLLWGALARRRLRPTRAELGIVLLTGTLLWVGGNGTVNWAEQHVESGYAALLLGTTPIAVALMEALVDRRRPSGRLLGAMCLGFAGLVVLTLPVVEGRAPGNPAAVGMLLFATVSWGAGTILFKRRPLALSPQVSSGVQQLCAGAGFLLSAWLLGEFAGTRPPPSPPAWAAYGYLTLFGSVIAFTSFLQAVRLLPTRVVTTYAYVNPVVAIALGRWLLQETVTWHTFAGGALTLLGVAGVFRYRGDR